MNEAGDRDTDNRSIRKLEAELWESADLPAANHLAFNQTCSSDIRLLGQRIPRKAKGSGFPGALILLTNRQFTSQLGGRS